MKSNLTFFSLVALSVIYGCVDHDLSPAVPVNGEYLPTANKEIPFLREQFSDINLQNRYYYDTIKVSFSGDTLIDGLTYQTLQFYSQSESRFYDLYAIFRKDGPRYFDLPLGGESEGHVFLDLEKPVGGSWWYVSKFHDVKTIYTVMAVNTTRVVNNREYKNVIEMEKVVMAKDTEDKYYRVGSSRAFYAKDVGEIFSSSAWYVYTGATRISVME